jgi:hypothetical protein
MYRALFLVKIIYLELPIFSRKNIKTVSQAALKENLDFSNFGNIFKVAELSQI